MNCLGGKSCIKFYTESLLGVVKRGTNHLADKGRFLGMTIGV